MPGSKVPGIKGAFGWRAMPSWSKFCEHMPGEGHHQSWSEMDGAGICVAHSLDCCCVDIDTDDKEFADAIFEAIGPSPVKRRGSKGCAAYYRGNEALDERGARVTWYIDEKPCLDLLLPGSQSVLPPTRHPNGELYVWTTPDTLAEFTPDELPELPDDTVDRIDAALERFGATRKKPGKQVSRPDHDVHMAGGGGYTRTLNDRAISDLGGWFESLDLPGTRERGNGNWEAIPVWRQSNSGRPTHERNANLRASARGIVDFGMDVGYTPVNLVIAALGLSDADAISWLKERFPDPDDGLPEVNVDYDLILNQLEAANIAKRDAERALEEERALRIEAERETAPPATGYLELPIFDGEFRSGRTTSQMAVPSHEQFSEMMNPEMDFPIRSLDNLTGLLGELCQYIDQAVTRRTDLGSLAAALPVIAAMTPQYTSPTGLRTNVYTVSLAQSGAGKTQLRNVVTDMLGLAGVDQFVGHNDFTSSAALIKSLQGMGQNAKVSMIDEFGHMLQRLSNAKAANHERDLIRALTELFSASGRKFKGKAYATQDALEVDSPHFCLFGMATPGQFFEAFGSGGLDDGSFARYIIIPAGESYLQSPNDSLLESVAERVSDLAKMRQGIPSDIPVAFAVPAWSRWTTLRDQAEAFAIYCEENGVRGGAPIMRRVAEQAMKIAMIVAIGNDWRSPSVSERDLNIGHAIAWYCAAVMIGQSSSIVDNEHEGNKVKIKQYMQDQKGATKTQITRKFRNLRARDVREMISDLIEGGEAVEAQSKSDKGYAVSIYYAR
jgi:hypothetical protein